MGKNERHKNQEKHKNVSKKNQNYNTNYCKTIELQPLKDTTNEVKTDFEKQNKESKVIGGFNNLGNTCYLNTALQTLRQINYFSNFLTENNFSKTLKQLFHSTDHERQEKLNIIFEVSQKYQKHLQSGGDAYMCLLNLLEEISSEISDQEEFKKNFRAIFEDGMYCDNCEQYELSKLCDYIYILEDIFGIEEISLEAGIINPQSIYSECICLQNCSICEQPTLKPMRRLIFAPKFLFFKFIRQENINQPSQKKKARKQQKQQQQLQQEAQLNNSLIKENIQSNLFSYSLIGFSELQDSHYTYTAKYDSDWYCFSDLYGDKVERKDLRQNKTSYVVFIKQM